MPQAVIPVTVGTQDSDVLRSSTTSIATAAAAANVWTPGNTSVRCAYQFNSPNYQIFNGLLSFDTSSIPTGATVTGATLRFYSQNTTIWTDGVALALAVVADWQPWTGAATTDWANPPGTTAYGPSSYTNFAVNTQYDLVLAGYATGVVPGATTRLRLGISTNGGAPTGLNRLTLESFEGTTPGAVEPTLIVDYIIDSTPPAAPTGLSATPITTGD